MQQFDQKFNIQLLVSSISLANRLPPAASSPSWVVVPLDGRSSLHITATLAPQHSSKGPSPCTCFRTAASLACFGLHWLQTILYWCVWGWVRYLRQLPGQRQVLLHDGGTHTSHVPFHQLGLLGQCKGFDCGCRPPAPLKYQIWGVPTSEKHGECHQPNKYRA